MNKFVIGLVLIMLDFNLNIGNTVIGLIPGFVGYLVLYQGLQEMNNESHYFQEMQKPAIGMAVYSGVLYALDLLGVSPILGYISSVLGLVSVLMMAYITLNMVKGIQEMEARYNTPLNGNNLMNYWKVVTITSVAAMVFSLLFIGIVAIGCMLVSFIFGIVFAVAMNTSKNLYEKELSHA